MCSKVLNGHIILTDTSITTILAPEMTYTPEISPFVDTIYYRYDRQKFTIMTSNLSAEDLADKYGERIADRFTEMFDRIAFENYSYRK